MQLPRSLADFNKKVTNPIQSRWAGRFRPWIILVHTGPEWAHLSHTDVGVAAR